MNKDLYITLLEKECYYNQIDSEYEIVYTSDLKSCALPFGVKKINIISDWFYELKEGDLPNSITHLIFTEYKRELRGDIVSFCYHYQFKKGDIPNSVKYLKLEKSYNKIIEKDVLPEGLETLIFGIEYNNQCVIPKNVKYLEFGCRFNQSFYKDCILPENLIELKLGRGYNQPLIEIIEDKKMKLLPDNLKKLEINHWYISNKNFVNINKDTIPNNITSLNIDYDMILDDILINYNIKELCLIININKSLKNIIAETVEKLALYFYEKNKNEKNDLKIEIGDIPSNVKILEIHNYKYELIEGIIPNGVIELHISNTKIQNKAIPNTVKYLYLQIESDQILDNNIIPNNLIYLNIYIDSSCKYNYQINTNLYIPNSLLFLNINRVDIHDNYIIDITPILNHKNLIEIITPYKNIIDSKIIIGDIVYLWYDLPDDFIDNFFINYYNDLDKFSMYRCYKYNFDEYIKDIILNNKLIGQIILEELVAYVYKPSRLLKLCSDYNLSFDEINNIY